MPRDEVPIDPYDQATLEYLAAHIREDGTGVSAALVERVRRMAKDSAYWRMRAEVAEIVAKAPANVNL